MEDKKKLMEEETSSWLNSPIKPKHAKKNYTPSPIVIFSSGCVVGFILGAIARGFTR